MLRPRAGRRSAAGPPFAERPARGSGRIPGSMCSGRIPGCTHSGCACHHRKPARGSPARSCSGRRGGSRTAGISGCCCCHSIDVRGSILGVRGGLRMLDPRAPRRGRPCIQALAGRRVKGQVAKAVGLLGEVLCGTVVVPRARVSVVQVCGLGPAHNASGLRKHCVRPYITYRCAVLCARARAL